jgi:hypothetical protein
MWDSQHQTTYRPPRPVTGIALLLFLYFKHILRHAFTHARYVKFIQVLRAVNCHHCCNKIIPCVTQNTTPTSCQVLLNILCAWRAWYVWLFIHIFMCCTDRLCVLVIRVPGYRSRGPGSIPGVTRFSEKYWVWNVVHSASWVQLRSCLEEKVAALV